ncbi:hypothetical protein FBU59_002046 [Linderina macrospora]|uniref:Uncharacterized protein n=1 Tax=Linderina macrospora TaxID=4868 RepID=A0ACC1JCA7_9FUNG|nr:hypothetical protein FBU59_002046 [Linderina macrospora]
MTSSLLSETSDADHARNVVATAFRCLQLRAETNIDELLEISSETLQQRWDFLGPLSSTIQELDDQFFALVDKSLQWQEDNTGRYIRNVLADRLKGSDGIPSFLSPSNVAYMRRDPDTINAVIPFAKVSSENASEMTYVVLLAWEHGQWRYFNTCEFGSGSQELAAFVSTVADAENDYLQRINKAAKAAQESDEDDDYWDQFPQPDMPAVKSHKKQGKRSDAEGDNSEDDYWNQYGSDDEEVKEDAADEYEEDEYDEPENVSMTSELSSEGKHQITPNVPMLYDSLQDMLAGSAKLAKGLGMDKKEFLDLAAAMFY